MKYVGSCQKVRVDENSIKNKIYGPMMRRRGHLREVWGKSKKQGPERKVRLFSGSEVGEDWFVPIWEGMEQEARVVEEKIIKEWRPLANTAWVKANVFYERPRSIYKEKNKCPIKEEDARRTNIGTMAKGLVRMMKALNAAQAKISWNR